MDHVLQLSLSDVMGRGAPIWAATTTSSPAFCRPRKSPQRYFPLSPTQPTPATTALSIYVVSQNQHIILSGGWNLWSDFKHRVLHPIWMYGSESSWIQTKSGAKSPFGKLHFITCTPLCYRKSPKKSIRYHRSKNKNLPYILILSTCYTFFTTTKTAKVNLPTELVTIFRRLYFVDEILTSLANRISLRNNALSSSDFLKTTWEVKHRGGWAKWPCPHFDNTITQILTMHRSTHHTDPYNTQI